MEQTFIGLGFSNCDAFIGFVSGLGLDVGLCYYLVYVKGLGVEGLAIKEIIVKFCRLLLWLALMCVFGLRKTLFVPSRAARLEPLFSCGEVRIFFSQVAPKYVQSLSSWLIFELQLLALSSIRGISNEQRAAGAIWVQCEGALASSMQGWIVVANLRVQKLLGSRDAECAAKSFLVHNVLAAAIVALANTLPILLCTRGISRVVSNDPLVSQALEPLLLMLAVHVQTRVTNLTTGSLLIPVGKPMLSVVTSFVGFYFIGAPIALVGAFTDLLTRVKETKMLLCVGCTSVAQTFLSVTYVVVLCRMDWQATARVVYGRAQSDRCVVPGGDGPACPAAEVRQGSISPPRSSTS